MNNISECSATCLLNGVLHIWSEEIVAQDTPIISSNAVERAPMRMVTAMEEAMPGIKVNNESPDYGKSNRSKTINDGGITREEYCLKNPWAA